MYEMFFIQHVHSDLNFTWRVLSVDHSLLSVGLLALRQYLFTGRDGNEYFVQYQVLSNQDTLYEMTRVDHVTWLAGNEKILREKSSRMVTPSYAMFVRIEGTSAFAGVDCWRYEGMTNDKAAVARFIRNIERDIQETKESDVRTTAYQVLELKWGGDNGTSH